MPVLRYRDVRDVPPPAAVDPGDPALLERMRRRHAEPTDPGSRGGAR